MKEAVSVDYIEHEFGSNHTRLKAKINPGVFSLKKEVAGLDVNKESDDNKPADNKPTNEETKKTGSIFAKWKNSEAGKKAQDDDTKGRDTFDQRIYKFKLCLI